MKLNAWAVWSFKTPTQFQMILAAMQASVVQEDQIQEQQGDAFDDFRLPFTAMNRHKPL